MKKSGEKRNAHTHTHMENEMMVQPNHKVKKQHRKNMALLCEVKISARVHVQSIFSVVCSLLFNAVDDKCV